MTFKTPDGEKTINCPDDQCILDVAEVVRNVLQFSPMVQIVTMAHHVTLYGELPTINSILYAVFSISIIVGIGYGIFRKLQGRIVEEM